MATFNIGPCECCDGGAEECNTLCYDEEGTASITLAGFAGLASGLNGGYSLDPISGGYEYFDAGPPIIIVTLTTQDGCGASVIAQIEEAGEDLCGAILTDDNSPPQTSGCNPTGDLLYFSPSAGNLCDLSTIEDSTGTYTYPTL